MSKKGNIKMKKAIITLLAASLAVGMIGGCGEKTEKKQGEEVTLKWVMPGPGKQKDSDEIWEAFNKELKTYPGLENVTVAFDIIPAGDYAQKFLMAQTSGDPMDIIQTYTLDFTKEARNGTFAPLDEYLDNEMSDIKNDLPEFIMDYGKVDGSTYAIMNYQMCPYMWALNINKEIADKYIDINELKTALSEKELNNKVYDILEQLFDKADANGELGMGFCPRANGYLFLRLADRISPCFGLNVYDGQNKVENIYTDMPFKEMCERMKAWYKKGYIRKDVLSVSDWSTDKDKEGGYLVYIDNNYQGKEEKTNVQTGVTNYVLYLYPNPIVPYKNAAGGNAIYASSQNKEAAAKVINLLNSQKGKNLYNLLVWGQEGKHYNKISEDKIETLGYTGQGNSSADYGLWKWVVGNTKYAYETQADPEGYKDFVFGEFNEGKNTVISPIIGFKEDLTAYDANVSQIQSVIKEYENPISFGTVEDLNKTYNEFIEKLNTCGADKVKKELQKQLDEYLAKK